jgi:hypothetical protein
MEPLIDAIFSEGVFWTLVILTLVIGPPTGARFKARHDLKAAAQRQQFELEKRKLDIEHAQLEAKKPTCLTCGHGSGFHEVSTGACKKTEQEPNQWNEAGTPTGYEKVSCECLDYTGPNPGITGSILGELGS